MVDKLKRILFRTDRQGLEHLLGSLEAQIMELIWQAGGPVTIRQVWEGLSARRRLSFNTVMTVMNRLVGKGLLVRDGAQPPYSYRARLEREAFLRETMRDIFSSLLHEYGKYAVSQFVDVAVAAGPEVTAELEDLLRRARVGAAGSDPSARHEQA